jgi:hypothetical protein
MLLNITGIQPQYPALSFCAVLMDRLGPECVLTSLPPLIRDQNSAQHDHLRSSSPRSVDRKPNALVSLVFILL